MPTLENISKAYETIAGRAADKEKLLWVLSENQKLGVVQENIANRQDKPVQIWTTNCSCKK